MEKNIWLLRLWTSSFLIQAACFLILGGIFTFYLPPFQAPDEFVHWDTAVHKSKIVLGEEKKHCGMEFQLLQYLGVSQLPFHANHKVTTGRFEALRQTQTNECKGPSEVAEYASLISYPQVILGKLLTVGERVDLKSALFSFYLSRLFAGLIIFLPFARFLYICRRDRFIQPGILSAWAIFLSPIAVQQSFAITADVVTNAFIVSQITLVLLRSHLNAIDYIFYALFGLAAAATKPVILPISALYILCVSLSQYLKKRRGITPLLSTQSKNRYGMIVGAIVSSVALIVLLTFDKEGAYKRLPGVNPVSQMDFILSNPLSSLLLLMNSTLDFLQLSTFGSPLGWLDTALSESTIQNYQYLLFMTLSLDIGIGLAASSIAIRRCSNLQRAVQSSLINFLPNLGVICGSLCMGLLSGLAMYISHTKAGGERVEGLQARYFIPIIACITSCLIALFPALHFEKNDAYTPQPWHLALYAPILFTLGAISAFHVIYLGLDLSYRYW